MLPLSQYRTDISFRNTHIHVYTDFFFLGPSRGSRGYDSGSTCQHKSLRIVSKKKIFSVYINTYHARPPCWGIPSPTRCPMGLPTFFLGGGSFFFLPPHCRWPFVVKKTTDWAEILHNHTYGHSSGRGKKYLRCAHFIELCE